MTIEYTTFLKNLQKLNVDNITTSIALAISGGADSLCMAYLTSKHYNKTQLKCLIVDHHLRDESTAEANLVKNKLYSYGLDSTILDWFPKEDLKNIQAIARKARYDLLVNYCKQNNIRYLFIGHNKNDQAETVLMRIFRGTGIDGLSGINEINKIEDINIIRPLLKFTRIEIESTLKQAKWKNWVNDPSNKDLKYERTKVRKLIDNFPNQLLFISRLVLLANNALRAKEFINKEVYKAWNRLVEQGRYNDIHISRIEFLKLDKEVAYRLLVQILNNVSGKHYPPRLDSLILLYKNILNESYDKTLWGCEIKISNLKILFYRELRAVESIKYLSKNIEYHWDNRYKVMTKEQGLSIRALGIDGLKQLKTLVRNNKLSAKIMYSTPGIFKNENLVYYPLLKVGDANKIQIFEKLNQQDTNCIDL